MVRDIDLFFDPQSREYIVVSEGYSLRMNEKQFKDIRGSVNGVAYALQRKARKE